MPTTLGDLLQMQSPIVVKWKEILAGLKDNGRLVTVRSAAQEFPRSYVEDVEEHIVILLTPSRLGQSPGAYESNDAYYHGQRHFVALDAIIGISRDLSADEVSEDEDGAE